MTTRTYSRILTLGEISGAICLAAFIVALIFF